MATDESTLEAPTSPSGGVQTEEECCCTNPLKEDRLEGTESDITHQPLMHRLEDGSGAVIPESGISSLEAEYATLVETVVVHSTENAFRRITEDGSLLHAENEDFLSLDPGDEDDYPDADEDSQSSESGDDGSKEGACLTCTPFDDEDTTPSVPSWEELEKERIQRVRDVYDFPDSWSDEDVAKWLEVNPSGLKTHRDNWIYDPTRENRDPTTWPDSEILDWMDGFLMGSDPLDPQVDAIIDEYRNRTQDTHSDWNNNQFLAWYRFGLAPVTTSSGVALIDDTRDNKTAAQWSDAELDAWAHDQIDASLKASDDALALELQFRADLPTHLGNVNDVKFAYLNNIRKKRMPPPPKGLPPMDYDVIHSGLESYYNKVRPGKPIKTSEGEKAERGLYQTLLFVVKKQGNEFVECMDYVLEFVRKHRNDVFDPTYSNRFSPEIKNAKIRYQLINLVMLFHTASGPHPKRLSRMDIPSVLAQWDDTTTAKLTEYFKSKAQ